MTKLWLDIPYKKQNIYNPNETLLHYPNDIAIVAKEIDRLDYPKVRINSIVDIYSRTRNDFSNEFKQKLIDYLKNNTRLKVIDSDIIDSDLTYLIRSVRKRAKDGVVDIYGYFKNKGETIPMEFRVINEENRVMKSFNNTFKRNSNENTTLSSLTIANYLKISSEVKNNMIKIMATKGEDDIVYFDREKIKIQIELKKPMYLQIFNIDGVGEVYPLSTNEKTPYQANIIHTLPEKNSRWDWRVEPPFGYEGLKFIATSEYIAMPKKAESMVEYF